MDYFVGDADNLLRFEEFDDRASSTSTRIDVEGQSSNKDNKTDESVPSILSWPFYQRYFDVDTDLVKERLLWAFVPRSSDETLTRYTKPMPDLYGPFWVSITLVFFIAITGNISDYLHRDDERWRYDFKKVSVAASFNLAYAIIPPTLLWIWWHKKPEISIGLLDIISLYGYCLTIYIPFSLLLTIPVASIQWIVVFFLAALSGSFIVLALWKPLNSQPKRFLVLAAVLLVQFGFTVALQLMFYHHTEQPTNETSMNTEISTTTESLVEKVIELKPLENI